MPNPRSRLPKKMRKRAPHLRDTWGPWQERFLEGHPEAPTGLHRAWFNSKYSVQLVKRNELEVLMVRRHSNVADFPWLDLQRIKDELVGPEREAIQVHPKRAELVNDANMAHLWVITAEQPLPFTFKNLGWGQPAAPSNGESLAEAAHAAAAEPEEPPAAAAITVVNGATEEPDAQIEERDTADE